MRVAKKTAWPKAKNLRYKKYSSDQKVAGSSPAGRASFTSGGVGLTVVGNGATSQSLDRTPESLRVPSPGSRSPSTSSMF
jgi:hypothetical protein